jgi:1,4-alpha-glucan branching enzyme
MLYLDYGRNAGEWLPNIYGSNENLDAVELFKHMNSIMKKRNSGVVMIAEDSSLCPDVTKSVEDDGLGFDYKRNLGWSEDMMDYVQTPVGLRRDKHNALTFSLLYAYNEQYMYGFGHKNIGVDGILMNQIDGNQIQKEGCVKALLGYLMMQPGKKYTFLEQSLPLTGKSVGREPYAAYIKALNALYAAEPALYAQDYDENGFEWINTLSAKDGILVFARKTANVDDTLVVILNLSGIDYQNYQIGVPYAGKYKEIFNSDATEFGGENKVNARMRQSKAEACDARENSITTTVPAFGISVYKYNVAGTVTPVKKTAKKAGTAKTAEKKPAEKKTKTTKPAEKKAAENKTETTKPVEKKVAENKAETTKPAEKKVAENKAETTKPAEKKAAENKAETTKPVEKKPAESKTESTKPVRKSTKAK